MYVFGQAPRFFFSGCVGYFVGNIVNAHITAFVARRSSNPDSELKNLFPITVGIFVDLMVFMTMAYLGKLSFIVIFSMTFNYWILNVLWVLIAKPFIGWTLRWAKTE